MFLTDPMTIQKQSRASCYLLPPASTQLFWPRGPISLACLWEHWASVSFQNRGCVPRAPGPVGRAHRAQALLQISEPISQGSQIHGPQYLTMMWPNTPLGTVAAFRNLMERVQVTDYSSNADAY